MLEELERLQVRQRPAQNERACNGGFGRSESDERDGPFGLGGTRRKRAAVSTPRCFAPAQQAGQVVPGVVLHQAAHMRDDRARPQHGLHAQELRPRRPVPQDLQAPGIRGDSASTVALSRLPRSTP